MALIKPIGYIRTDFKEKFGIPRQSGRVSELEGRIIIEPEFAIAEAFRGIEEFSHLWLIFDFSESHRENWSPTVRPPRLGGNKRMGVFATRSPFRPNSLGLSCVEFKELRQFNDTVEIIVSGADLLDNTPIYDIKPYIPHADCRTNACGSFADTAEGYRLEVFPDPLLTLLPENKRAAAIACLAEDPRPAYQNDPERIYTMGFAGYEISFKVNENKLYVINVTKGEKG